ncbi:MAG TPA: carboxypeptidase regulatory-like domain-containing protein [Pyrinomonadaceae bacterium]|nr:carboxypeptidase regulatory-like domain-containing protein [Pyrinomonadaceae bacterium]
MKSPTGHFVPFLLLVLVACLAASGQDLDDVTISGKIVDSNGLAVAGATVTAVHIGSYLERVIISNDDGRYRFIELRPGAYRLRAVAEGFAAREIEDIPTLSGQNVKLDLSLAPAGVTAEATVAVGDDAPIVDTTRTVVGGTVTAREAESLPNIGRDALDLVFTLGGVAEEPLSLRDLSLDKGDRNETPPSSGLIEGGVFSLSGGAAYSNNLTVDGFDNNDDRVAGIRFQPSVESIDEVQVINNQFSAEYGRASGGRVNIRTRAGSQQFRGRAFYFFADESLNANTWSNNYRNVPRYPFQQHVPGFTLGGPIPLPYFRTRTTFYTAYEYDFMFDSTITDTYVPIVQNRLFPLPEPTSSERITDFGSVLGRYIAGSDTPRRQHRFTARGDHNFTDSHAITLSYQLGKTNDLRQFNGGNRLAESLIGKRTDTHAINFTDNFVLNAAAVNQFRLQYSMLKPVFVSSGQQQAPVVLISFREPNSTSNTTLTTGASSLGTSGREEERWQIQDAFTFVAGKHSLRAGFDYQRVDSTYIDLTDAGGTYNFADPLATTTVPQCLTDPSQSPGPNNPRIRGGVNTFPRSCVTRYRQSFFTDSKVTNNYYGLFIQDDWRARERLTFNFGLRYERETVVDDKNNWGPRMGVAWSPFKSDKGVIRFGAGMFYNRVLLRTVDDYQRGRSEIVLDTNRVASTGNARDVYLRELSNLFPRVLMADHPLVQQYIAAGLNETSFFRSLSPELKIPESYQLNLGFEREIADGFVFEANLTYNRTARLWREVNTNAPIVPKGYLDLADYLDRGVTNGNVQFEFAGVSAPDSRTDGQVTIYNLNSQNTSTAASSPYGRALAIASSLKPFPEIGQTEQVGSMGNSWYTGLILELRRRYARLPHGFGSAFRIVYTLSHTEDDGIVNTSSAQIPGDFSSERAASLLDRHHRLAVSGVFDTPSWLGKVQFSPIVRWASGAPFNLSNGGDAFHDRNLDDVNTDRPDFAGGLEGIRWRRITDPLDLGLARSFTLAPIGRAGSLGRNAGHGPPQFIFDLNVSREFKFTERIRLRPQIEFNNVLNATAFSFGSEFINYEAVAGDPTPVQIAELKAGFLVPTRAYRPRQIRIGVRLDF